jgi:hypothetical protein
MMSISSRCIGVRNPDFHAIENVYLLSLLVALVLAESVYILLSRHPINRFKPVDQDAYVAFDTANRTTLQELSVRSAQMDRDAFSLVFSFPSLALRSAADGLLWTVERTLKSALPDSQRRAVERVSEVLFSNVLKLEDSANGGRFN